MTDRHTYSAKDIAFLMQHEVRTFYGKIDDWMENHGFPQKIPGTNRWSRHAVDHWFRTDCGRRPELAGELPTPELTINPLEAEYLN